MAHGLRPGLSLATLAVLWVWTGGARAGVEPSPFFEPFATGSDTPVFWVLFNPRPRPSADDRVPMLLDTSEPAAPTFQVRNTSSGSFRLELAFQHASQRSTGFRHEPLAHGFRVSALNLAETLFTAHVSFAREGEALDLGARVDFEPQPDPPGFPGVLVEFTLVNDPLRPPLADGAEVEMTLRVSRPDGESLPLTRIPVTFVRGDANADGAPDLSDAITILGSLFLGSAMNDCEDAADINDDGVVDISDPVRLLGHLFLGSEAPPDPFSACGVDATGDDLGCRTFAECP